MFTLLIVCMTSCTSTYHISRQPEIFRIMVGRTQQSIVSEMGVPDRQTSDGAGGTILVYEQTTSDSIATAYDVNYFTGTYIPGYRTTSFKEYINLYINPQGKCYDVKTNLTREETVINPEGSIISILLCLMGAVLLGAGGI